MDIQAALELSMKVIADGRVIFITVAVLLSWAALRYVGMVYHKPAKKRPAAPRKASPAPAAPRKAEAKGGRPEVIDDDVIE